MDPETANLFAIAAVMVFGTIFPAFAVGWIGSKGVDLIGRNPEAAPKVQTAMILAIAFAEAIAIYALVVALILKFV
jgi:F-type H+-transporting ATPase subunit c